VKSSQGEVVTRWTRHKSEKTRQWTRHLWRVHRVTSSLAPALPDSTTNRKHSRQWTVPFHYTKHFAVRVAEYINNNKWYTNR